VPTAVRDQPETEFAYDGPFSGTSATVPTESAREPDVSCICQMCSGGLTPSVYAVESSIHWEAPVGAAFMLEGSTLHVGTIGTSGFTTSGGEASLDSDPCSKPHPASSTAITKRASLTTQAYISSCGLTRPRIRRFRSMRCAPGPCAPAQPPSNRARAREPAYLRDSRRGTVATAT
jgi:hypothetical protein